MHLIETASQIIEKKGILSWIVKLFPMSFWNTEVFGYWFDQFWPTDFGGEDRWICYVIITITFINNPKESLRNLSFVFYTLHKAQTPHQKIADLDTNC